MFTAGYAVILLRIINVRHERYTSRSLASRICYFRSPKGDNLLSILWNLSKVSQFSTALYDANTCLS